MNTTSSPWYAFTADGGTTLRCAHCGEFIDLGGPALDHHPRVCPKCGVQCVYLNWKGRTLQIVLSDAPAVLTRAIRLAQQHFDELESVELIVVLEQLMDDLYGQSTPEVRNAASR
jgi:hypothetical protein